MENIDDPPSMRMIGGSLPDVSYALIRPLQLSPNTYHPASSDIAAPRYTLLVSPASAQAARGRGGQLPSGPETAPSGQGFDHWTGDTSNIADVSDPTTTLTMPAANQETTATYSTLYTLTVNSGTGDGSYISGKVVNISADSPASGKQFDDWVGDTSGVANVNASSTTITMPSNAAEITATYTDVGSGPSVSSISGTVSDDNNITISGSSFGSHNLNTEWLGGKTGHIESATDGAVFSKTNWAIVSFPGTFDPFYDSTKAYSHDQSVIFDSVYYDDGRIGIRYDPGSNVTFGYATWYAYIDLGGATGQWKMFRMRHASGVTDTAPEFVMFNWFYSTGKQFMVRATGAGDTSQRYYLGTTDYPEEGEWCRLELFMQASSSPGEYDCSIQYYIHRPGSSITKALDKTALRSYVSGETARWRYYIFQNYQGNGLAGSSKVWMDDIYIQDTKARVEIGDASTWSGCTHREIQPPSAWSGSSITIKLNQGSFTSLSGKYLYVVDSSGNVSAGYGL